MIHTQDLYISFGTAHAVTNLSVSIPAGEDVVLFGPNVAGKTTTLRMLIALISPSSREARLPNCRIGNQYTGVRRNVGILTESSGRYERLSAEQYLVFFASLYRFEDIPAQVESSPRRDCGFFQWDEAKNGHCTHLASRTKGVISG